MWIYTISRRNWYIYNFFLYSTRIHYHYSTILAATTTATTVTLDTAATTATTATTATPATARGNLELFQISKNVSPTCQPIGNMSAN